MKFSWGGEAVGSAKDNEKVQLQDIVEEVDRHARLLGRKEDLSG